MKDTIFDIVKHTAGLGFIEQVKVTGEADETTLQAADVDRTVVMNAKLHAPVADFAGEFGVGNLSFLNGVCSLPNYKEDTASVEVQTRDRNGVTSPESLKFKDAEGNNDTYRLMSKEIVEQTLKTLKFKEPSWDVVFEPSKAKVSELTQVAGIYGGIEPTFSVKTEDGNLIVTLGSAEGGFLGKRTFANNVNGEINEGWSWPLGQVLAILKLGMSGVCNMKFSSAGALMISIDSGLGQYDYILPANTK